MGIQPEPTPLYSWKEVLMSNPEYINYRGDNEVKIFIQNRAHKDATIQTVLNKISMSGWRIISASDSNLTGQEIMVIPPRCANESDFIREIGSYPDGVFVVPHLELAPA